MTGAILAALGALFGLLLIAALVCDVRSRIIPNRLNLAIAVAAAGFWLAQGAPLWPGAAVQAGVAAGLFVLCALLFQIGAMGGGDVKMIAAASLGFAPGEVVKLLLIMSVAGGALSLAMLAWQRARRGEGRPEVPYGAAIAAAGLWLLSEPYLYHFG